MATALVIDDNRQTADSLCKMISMLGVPAKPAYGARSAILALNQVKSDIVFLDISMPGVDGFEIMAYIKRQPALAKIPVVFVTSDDQPETIEKARETGALNVIIKPVTIEALERTLKTANLI